jgi:1-acyl-sn-glycerol-3-phosphate acyltransferase
VGRFLIAAGFALVSLAMRAAVRVYFRRLHVRHLARFPRRGPVLLVANHPAMWTDVLVLDVALGRKLHFLAQGELFRPALRGLLLELHGALPVFRVQGPEERGHNQATFLRCRELFARGEVVALFPEGVSSSDRQVLRLKTGAARIALDAAEHASSAEAVPVVMAAGIHYADRTSYGSEVTVSLGTPLRLGSWLTLQQADPETAVHALTDALHDSLRTLILDLPEPALAAAVSELEPLAGFSRVRGVAELESAQRIAATLEHLRVTEPGRFKRIQSHAHAYRRARRALGLSDRALTWDPARATWLQQTSLLALYCVLGALPAAVGAVLHVLPWAAGEWVAHSVGRDPTRFTFGRISSGLVFFPLTYAMLFVILTRFVGESLVSAAALLGVTLLLGLFTLHYVQRSRSLWERARLMLARWSHPRLVARARREQRGLLRLLAGAARAGSVSELASSSRGTS